MLVAKGCDRAVIDKCISVERDAKRLPRVHKISAAPKNFRRDLERAAAAVVSLFQMDAFEPELAYLYLEDFKNVASPNKTLSPRTVYAEWVKLPLYLMLLVRAVVGARGPTRKTGASPLLKKLTIPNWAYYQALVCLKTHVREKTGRPHLKELADLLGIYDENQNENRVAMELRRAERYWAYLLAVGHFLDHTLPRASKEKASPQGL